MKFAIAFILGLVGASNASGVENVVDNSGNYINCTIACLHFF